MWKYLILGVTFAFAAAVQPGPFQTYLVTETMSRRWHKPTPIGRVEDGVPQGAITLKR